MSTEKIKERKEKSLGNQNAYFDKLVGLSNYEIKDFHVRFSLRNLYIGESTINVFKGFPIFILSILIMLIFNFLVSADLLD